MQHDGNFKLVVINRPRPSADGCGRRGSSWTYRLVQMVAPGILHDLGMDPNSPLEAVKDALVKCAKGHMGTGSDHTSGRWVGPAKNGICDSFS